MGPVLLGGGRTARRVLLAGVCSAFALLLSGAAAASAAGWSVVPSPANGVLNSVSCTSWSACSAVGLEGTSTEGGNVLAERWNGARWSVQSLPAVPGGQSQFTDVSCGSPRFCVADGVLVYSTTFTGRVSSLVGTWDGSGWSIRKLPYGRTAGTVSCTSRRFCVLAEGCVLPWCEKIGSVPEEWNGSRWSPMNGTGQLSGKLGAVTCMSPTSCVGIAFGITGASSARWDGKTWSLVAPLDTSFVYDAAWAFSAPSCASANSCAVVGSASQDCSFAPLSFVERWNGAHWSKQPATATYTATFSGISCGGPKFCTAIGDEAIQPETPQPLGFVDRWNGSRWSLQPSAGPAGSYSGSLQSIYCAAARCLAVGSWQPSATAPLQTLVEQSPS
jgi:hypothetical protein